MHILIAGVNITGGLVSSTGRQSCVFITTCVRIGPGFYGGFGGSIGGGILNGNTYSALSGMSCGFGGDIGWGPSYGGAVSFGQGESSTGATRGKGGGGVGLNIGLECCYTGIECDRECRPRP